MIGKKISHYKITEKLGEGGMGEVYLADDTKLKRQVAIKFLPSRITVNEADKARFLQEAQAAAAINHPNVCVIHEIQDQEEHPFIVMEYVDGLTLSDKISAESLPIKQIVEYAFQIGEALQAAHNKGIVHRDVKSDNIMITGTNQIKVMDFGLAKLKGSIKLTKTSSTVGTLAYMAPEQIEGKDIDARSDIFSFGVVLYEMLAGQLPFSGEYESAMMYSILNEEPLPFQKSRPDVSSELIHVLNRALEKDPEDRYPNMKEILIDLKRIKRDTSKVTRRVPVQIPETEEVIVQKTEEKPVKKSKRYIVFSGAVLSVLIILVFVFLIFKPFTKEPKPPMKTIPFTSSKGVEKYPSFSPDGNYITFCSDGGEGGNINVYVKQIDGRGRRQLTDHQGEAKWPVYSPNGLNIAYLYKPNDEKESGIYKIPALGGSSQLLHAVKWGRSNISWSSDDKYISYSERDSLNRNNIYLLSLDDREITQLTNPPASGIWDDLFSTFSPDGKQIAFVRGTAGRTHDIYIIPVSGGEPKRLTRDNKWIMDITWTHDGRDIIFSSNRDGAQRLWRISIEGGKPEPLAVAGTILWGPAISKDGHWLAYHSWSSVTGRDIWRVELNDSNLTIDEPVRLIFSNKNENHPQYSPDGSSIAFISDRSAYPEIWRCDSLGENLQQLTHFDRSSLRHPRWSPDGRYIAFDTVIEEQRDIYAVSADGSSRPRQVTTHKSSDGNPSWSNDGQWIYFLSVSFEDRKPRCWKIPWQGGNAIQVMDLKVKDLRESPDGKWLYYERDKLICRMPIEGGDEEACVQTNTIFIQYAVFEDGIYYKDVKKLENGEVWGIYYLNFKTKMSKPVIEFERGPIDPSFDISLDRRWLLYSVKGPSECDIYLVENWQ